MVDKEKQFEAIIQSEISSSGLEDLLDASEVASEKVKEVVGEQASESIPTATSKTQSGFASISQKITGILFSSKKEVIKLPQVQVQRKQVKKFLVKRTRKLIGEATKIQNSRNFSAAKLESVLVELRGVQQILADLYMATVSKIENLYKTYVLKK